MRRQVRVRGWVCVEVIKSVGENISFRSSENFGLRGRGSELSVGGWPVPKFRAAVRETESQRKGHSETISGTNVAQ
jgi:hypothetical protein